MTISLPTWLYFALSERSRRRATVGKRILGLQVMSVAGGRISFWQALWRTAVKLLPWELTHLTLMLPVPLWWVPDPELRIGLIIAYLLLGVYLIVVWRHRQKRGPHDLIAGTVVVTAKREN